MTWTPPVARPFSASDFAAYVSQLTLGAWHPQFVVVHNTQSPCLADWHQVDGSSRMRGLANYYQSQGWHAGPHLFVADDAIWAFTPLTLPGVHSPSWNGISWGVECVGDFSTEYMGPAQQELLTSALATLHAAGGLVPSSLKFHHEDPLTTHRGCPGVHLVKQDVIQWVQARLSPIVQP